MGVNAAGHKDYTLDAETLIHDGLIAATGVGTVSAVAQVVDFGNTDVNSVENVAYTPFDLVIEVTAQEVASTDEDYKLILQLADDNVVFASATTVRDRAQLQLGAVTVGTNAVAYLVTDLGRVVMGLDNQIMGVVYRYARIIHIVAGTIATGLNYTAYLSRH